MKLCLAHPGLGAGGSEAGAMALLELAQHEFEMTLATGSPFDCERLNQSYHTEVSQSRVSVALAPIPAWLRRARSGDALRGALFSRYVRQIAPRFDLCVSAYNFIPFGRPAIQFVADFSWDDALRRENDPPSPGLRGLAQRSSLLRNLYLRAVHAISGGGEDRSNWRDDIVVANSRWTADVLAQRHGIASRVIYPPVHAEPFEAEAGRSGDFVTLGRIAPDKRVEEAIDVLACVRARGHKFNFNVIGPLDDSAYSERLRNVAQNHGDWVRLRGGIYGSEKFAELARHSFGLHMRAREPFGIAVAEQVKMGLIPFVPAETAPAEIVGDPRLCFVSRDHAVEVIDGFLRRPDEHQSIRAALAARGRTFSTERFAAEVKPLLREALSEATASRERVRKTRRPGSAMQVMIVHPGLAGGGSEARALTLIELLQEEHQVTLLTGAPFECARLNATYHTAVDPSRVAVEFAPMPRWLRHSPAGDALRGAFVNRHVRRLAPRFDLCIGAYNFVAFGRKAIQFVADFSWDDDYRRANDPSSPCLRGLLQRRSPARAAYLQLCRLVAGGSLDLRERRQDIVVANSQWTADLLRTRHGLASRVIYPPVFSPPFDPAAPRSGDFVMLGRIAPDKRVLGAIDTLARVRARGHDFIFHIVGLVDDSAYGARVRALAAQHGDWVRLEGAVYGDDKFRLLARHGFALHMRTREAFGIAVAEQVKMGLIPFLHAESAPAEIVADPRLCFRDGDDAVEVIDRVLRMPEAHQAIRSSLAARGALFSKERFIAEARALLGEAILDNGKRA
jgi:glycosyltransferase involved in cell wall biosynthesis